MNLQLIFDTETTGIPDWKTPSGGENQPHIVQLAALLADADKRKVIQSMDVIIKPDGWSWDAEDEAFKTHGITFEHAMDVGIPEKMALEMFLAMWAERKRIAYNTTFDNRIIRIATKRYCDEAVIDDWKGCDYECAMMMSKKHFGVKSIKLVDAYQRLFGKEYADAHSAMADTQACMGIYFAIIDQKAGVA